MVLHKNVFSLFKIPWVYHWYQPIKKTYVFNKLLIKKKFLSYLGVYHCYHYMFKENNFCCIYLLATFRYATRLPYF